MACCFQFHTLVKRTCTPCAVCSSLRMQVNISKTQVLVFNVLGRQTLHAVQGRLRRIKLSAKYIGMWLSKLLAEATTRGHSKSCSAHALVC